MGLIAPRLLLGFALGALVAWLAWRTGALTGGGALGAAVVGGMTFGLGGLTPAALLVLFFVSSSALSRLGRGRKAAIEAAFSKSARRDLGQVLANGALAALLAIPVGLFGDPLWLAALSGALAAANADTWATELGVLARRPPRLITTGAPVEVGTSGAVSLEGSAAALGGASLVGLVAAWLGREPSLFAAALAGGAAGAALDSLLGATVQAVYRCPACARETERHPLHVCGTATERVRGWPWLNNDAVNALATVAGAVVAGGVWLALEGLVRAP